VGAAHAFIVPSLDPLRVSGQEKREEGAVAEPEVAAQTALKQGDIVLVEYTLVEKESGKVVETTSEAVAKEAGVYSEESKYGPKLVVIGSGELPSGLEEALANLREGEEVEVTLPPEKAFGKRDPSKVRVIPARELSSRGVVPRVGMVVEVRGERGVVLSVGSGRVIVDFNHPLAGREVVCRAKLVKVLREPLEKVKGLLERRIAVEDIGVTIEGDTAAITLPYRLLYSSESLAALEQFARDVEMYVKEVRRVVLTSTLFERAAAEQKGTGGLEAAGGGQTA